MFELHALSLEKEITSGKACVGIVSQNMVAVSRKQPSAAMIRIHVNYLGTKWTCQIHWREIYLSSGDCRVGEDILTIQITALRSRCILEGHNCFRIGSEF